MPTKKESNVKNHIGLIKLYEIVADKRLVYDFDVRQKQCFKFRVFYIAR